MGGTDVGALSHHKRTTLEFTGSHIETTSFRGPWYSHFGAEETNHRSFLLHRSAQNSFGLNLNYGIQYNHPVCEDVKVGKNKRLNIIFTG